MQDHELEVAYDIFRRGYRITNEGSGAFLGIRGRANCPNPLGASGDDGKLLSHYQYLSYAQVDRLARSVGTALLKLDLVKENVYPEEAYPRAQRLRVLCVASRNRAEWFITDLACQLFGLTTCPLYETFGEKSIAFILAQSSSSIVAGSQSNLKYILEVLDSERETRPTDSAQENSRRNSDQSARTDSIKYFFSFDNHVPLDIQERAAAYHIQILTWKQVVDQGDSFLAQDEAFGNPPKPHPHDVCSICYTSGTTGVPKGVLITQKAFAANISAALRGPLQGQGLDITPEDIYISYLPLAHVLERVLCCICMAIGAKLAIYSGDTRTLLEDIRIAEPTIFASVPRLFMRINDRIQTGLDQNSPVVRYLYEKGMTSKLARLREQGEVQHAFWDTLIFKRIRQLLGSRLRYMISGGAALEKDIQEKMACLFSCRLLEGYGLTETLGATFIRRAQDALYGHIGMPLPCVEIKLIAVPEMGYYVTKEDQIAGEKAAAASPKDLTYGRSPRGSAAGGSAGEQQKSVLSSIDFSPTGELAVRGYTVTPGYFLNSEATVEAFELADAFDGGDGRQYGWFKTGDIAVRLSDEGGRVKIIDRKKNLFKMSQGEYIAPERIENVYSQIPIISQIFVYGDSSRVYLVGIVTLDTEEYAKWRASNSGVQVGISASGKLAGGGKEESENSVFKKYLLSEMERVANDAQLKGFEKVKNIYFTTDQFTSEDGILTPTFKLKRNVATSRYWEQITALYNESF